MKSDSNNKYSMFPEWIETDGRGGYALGTRNLINYRRYHSLFTYSLNPPRDRVAILKCFDMRLLIDNDEIIFSNLYFGEDDFVENKNLDDLEFSSFQIPSFLYSFKNGIKLSQKIFIDKEFQKLFISFSLVNLPEKFKKSEISLNLRPLLSGNHHHHLLSETLDFKNYSIKAFDSYIDFYFKEIEKSFVLNHNGEFSLEENIYKNFFYIEEKERGFDFLESLYTPGILKFNLKNDVFIGLNEKDESINLNKIESEYKDSLNNELKKRNSLENKTKNHFIVENTKGEKSIIAGYPWFTDWGRDTFIALRGLCLGDYENYKNIILRWIDSISDGMIPNRFTDYGDIEYNSVDASLWLVICCYELLTKNPKIEIKDKILSSIDNIIESYFNGTRFNIVCDKDDYLLSQGQDGYALTWMDARVNGDPVTRREGKAIEIQALWINALTISVKLLNKREAILEKAKKSLIDKFWIKDKSFFKDYINKVEESISFRPNQIYLIGGLPFSSIPNEKAKLVLDKVKEELFTPYGLRSLAKSDKDYSGIYKGSSIARDSVYHQGTSWGFLLGPYFEAYLRVNEFTDEAKDFVRLKLKDFEALYKEFGCGQCYEIYDGDSPFKERGCPYQAWTFGEYLRIKHLVS